MSRCPDRHRAGALLAGVAAAVLLTAATPAQQPPGNAVGPVEDLVFFVESLDGTESVFRDDQQVTVTLTSDVLFALDEAELTAEARERLAGVAEQLRADGAGGVVTIAGHTDDQGSESYNQRLSERRAEAVRAELAERLADEDIEFETVGYGESQPREPNIVDGVPNEENRALNRRVEITYEVRE
ncbi:MAG TPA: OmpA family protein [Natronosporangium sp.]